MRRETALKTREACIAAGLAFLAAATQAAETRPSLLVDVGDGAATVIANDVPARRVLEEIALQAGIIVYSRAALDARVTYTIRAPSVPALLRRMLRQHNFTLHYVSDVDTGEPLFGSRLWIFADDDKPAAPLWGVGQPADEWTLRYAAGDPAQKRLQAISNIATWDDGAVAGPELLAALDDPAVDVRAEAVHVLGELSDPGSMNYLENALHDPEARVRVAAIGAIADSGGDSAAVLLSELLADPDPSIRTEVIHALAGIGGAVAQHYLQQALADVNETNRETAAEYLAEVGIAKPASRF